MHDHHHEHSKLRKYVSFGLITFFIGMICGEYGAYDGVRLKSLGYIDGREIKRLERHGIDEIFVQDLSSDNKKDFISSREYIASITDEYQRKIEEQYILRLLSKE